MKNVVESGGGIIKVGLTQELCLVTPLTARTVHLFHLQNQNELSQLPTNIHI